VRNRHPNTAPDVRSQPAGPRPTGTDGPTRTRTASRPAYRLGRHTRTNPATQTQRRTWAARRQHRNQPQAGQARTASTRGRGHLSAPGQAPAGDSNHDAVSPRLGPPDAGHGHSGLRLPPPGCRLSPRLGHGPGSTSNGSRRPGHGKPTRIGHWSQLQNNSARATRPRRYSGNKLDPAPLTVAAPGERRPNASYQQLGKGGPNRTPARHQT
jgi:hypothetical protein